MFTQLKKSFKINFMKTKLLFFVVLFGLSAATFAQDEPAKKSSFKFGPKVGIDLNADPNNLGDINVDPNALMKDNYQFGVFAQIGNRLYLQPEVYYAVQNIEVGGVLSPVESIKVPVHLGLKLLDIGLVSIHLTGGAMITQPLETIDTFEFDVEKIQYQVGVGVDVLGFITTDIRYTLNKDKTFAEQLDNFTTNGGMVNITVGLKL